MPGSRPRARVLAACLVALAASALTPGAARAHARSVSYSRWQIDGDTARVRARISLLELTRLGLTPDTPTAEVAAYLVDHLRLFAGEVACAPVHPPSSTASPDGQVAFRWTLRCPDTRDVRVRSDVLLDVAPSHLHFARVRIGQSRFVERVLTDGERSWPLTTSQSADAPNAAGTTLPGYVVLGIEHIMSGWDHMAFLLALLLIAGSLGEVASLVTAFTVAHSVTLGLATLGVLHPNGAAVEAMIGFSIALVAAENSWLLGGRDARVPLGVAAVALFFAALACTGAVAISPLAFAGLGLFSLCHFGLLRRAERPARLRAAIAFAFGLVHGFGFAGVLDQMHLERDRLLPALFGFNVGVEIGQLAVVGLIWPALRVLALRDDGRLQRGFAGAASAAICGLGLYWFVTRALG